MFEYCIWSCVQQKIVSRELTKASRVASNWSLRDSRACARSIFLRNANSSSWFLSSYERRWITLRIETCQLFKREVDTNDGLIAFKTLVPEHRLHQ